MMTRSDSRARLRLPFGVVLALLIVLGLVLLVLSVNGLWPFSRSQASQPSQETGPVVRIQGSNTIGSRLAPDLAQAYLESRGATDVQRVSTADQVAVLGTLPGADRPTRIEIRSAGTRTAFGGLLAGDTDVGMASRRITAEEEQGLRARGELTSRASEHVLALDAVAVVVHPDGGVGVLSVDQLRDIFSCRTTDWSQLGAPAGPIRVLARDDNSGTFDFFRDAVLGDTPLCATAERFEDSEELSQAVGRDRAAIGFIGLPFVGENTAVALFDGTLAPTTPTPLSVATESYLLTRRLYLYLPTLPVDDRLARDFVERFALSREGQRVVDTSGFVSPLFPPSVPPAPPVCENAPAEYCAFIGGAERIPFDVRFDSGTAELDNRAFRNVELFSEFMAAPERRGRQVLLVGFADNAGTDEANLELSRSRAASVMREMGAGGIANIVTNGFGEARPVATNDTEGGREQNRRVEVWLR